ncbi:hypothetical protein CMUS01_01445 [Colletotrichum musicola]|uniref:Uncharacterized protein n=1 Tax=Colletotrichum musicola TaxID=2175873 RepID=A0A8H6NX14_9PEZI|nr:hypothetical protein CMUS01_01445 [Colletotrichum musicola]
MEIHGLGLTPSMVSDDHGEVTIRTNSILRPSSACLCVPDEELSYRRQFEDEEIQVLPLRRKGKPGSSQPTDAEDSSSGPQGPLRPKDPGAGPSDDPLRAISSVGLGGGGPETSGYARLSDLEACVHWMKLLMRLDREAPRDVSQPTRHPWILCRYHTSTDAAAAPPSTSPTSSTWTCLDLTPVREEATQQAAS